MNCQEFAEEGLELDLDIEAQVCEFIDFL